MTVLSMHGRVFHPPKMFHVKFFCQIGPANSKGRGPFDRAAPPRLSFQRVAGRSPIA